MLSFFDFACVYVIRVYTLFDTLFFVIYGLQVFEANFSFGLGLYTIQEPIYLCNLPQYQL